MLLRFIKSLISTNTIYHFVLKCGVYMILQKRKRVYEFMSKQISMSVRIRRLYNAFGDVIHSLRALLDLSNSCLVLKQPQVFMSSSFIEHKKKNRYCTECYKNSLCVFLCVLLLFLPPPTLLSFSPLSPAQHYGLNAAMKNWQLNNQRTECLDIEVWCARLNLSTGSMILTQK